MTKKATIEDIFRHLINCQHELHICLGCENDCSRQEKKYLRAKQEYKRALKTLETRQDYTKG